MDRRQFIWRTVGTVISAGLLYQTKASIQAKPQEFKDIHVDKKLTDISVSYIQNIDDFISTKVFPIVNGKTDYSMEVKPWALSDDEIRASKYIADKMLLKMEKEWVTAFYGQALR